MSLPLSVYDKLCGMVQDLNASLITVTEFVHLVDQIPGTIVVSISDSQVDVMHLGSRSSIPRSNDKSLTESMMKLAGKLADSAGRIVGEDLNFGKVAPVSPLEISAHLVELKSIVSEYNRVVIALTQGKQ